jgi:glycosyltransferase involved in cell wall biosynthesis
MPDGKDGKLRILFASPAWWPAVSFGGPIWIGRELTERMAARGHDVRVLTSTLETIDRPGARRSRTEVVEGVRVRYLATPLRYRWMAVPPSLPVELARLERPDVVHVFGFRDVITTGVASWARLRRIPYVFEPLGMFRPRLRKVRLKRVFDATVARGVTAGAAAVVVSSSVERDDVLASGVAADRVRVRGCGFPDPFTPPGDGRLRRELGIPAGAPVVLYVGRIAAGKGIDLLLDALGELPGAHLVLAGPDDRHGVADRVRAAQAAPATAGRVHVFQPGERPLWIYPEADVLALPSSGESFGMVAAEAAAAGTPVVVSDRCGVADFFEEGEAVVVPYDGPALADALRRVLGDARLRDRLGEGARAAARRGSWDRVADRQEELYREVVAASSTAATRLFTLGS